MGRLVDLDTVPHWKITYTTNIRGRDELCETDMVLMKDLENAPAIDAVPVVRCKDCKYAEWWDNFEFDIGQYFCEFMEYNVELKDNDFCSKGERRETDDGNLF